MKQYAILCGCNEFGVEGASLRGCINDLRSMYDMLSKFYNYSGWEFDFLIDGRNTAANQRALIRKIIAVAQPGDTVIIHNSSHGTTIPVNGKIEHANVAYGFDWNDLSTFVLGSEYQAMILEKKDGVYLGFTTDSCNSGEMLNRGLLTRLQPGRSIIKKFIAPPVDFQWQLEHLAKQGVTAHPRGLIENVLDVAFSSGCGPAATDYSADCGEVDPTTGQENFFGAFTRYFTQTVLANRDKSFENVINLEVKTLAADQFDQAPVPYGAQISKIYCPPTF